MLFEWWSHWQVGWVLEWKASQSCWLHSLCNWSPYWYMLPSDAESYYAPVPHPVAVCSLCNRSLRTSVCPTVLYCRYCLYILHTGYEYMIPTHVSLILKRPSTQYCTVLYCVHVHVYIAHMGRCSITYLFFTTSLLGLESRIMNTLGLGLFQTLSGKAITLIDPFSS